MIKYLRHGSLRLLPVLLLLLLLAAGCAKEKAPPELAGAEAAYEEGLLSSGEAGRFSDGLCRVTFLDVGQGHATLFRTEEAAVLVDGGGRDTSSFVVSWLQEQGVSRLDLMVATHGDADHISGLIGVMNQFKVEEVWAFATSEETSTVRSFFRTAERFGIPVAYPSPGEEREAGRMRFQLLAPFEPDELVENNNSLVVKMSYGETSVVITGDAQTEEEQRMLSEGMDVSAQVLLAGHHGSSNSSSEAFLQAVRPEYTVISCGRDNLFEHPHQVTLRRLRAVRSDIFRTDLQGTVECTLDGENITWNVEAWEKHH